jgi:hypothetical protein
MANSERGYFRLNLPSTTFLWVWLIVTVGFLAGEVVLVLK